MALGKSSYIAWAAVLALFAIATPARAAFHLWNISEVYTNSSGTLQFIEFQTNFGNQQFVNGQSINVSNIGMSLTNSFTLPSNLPGDSTNRFFVVGTAGIQAAGGPAPDYIIPNGFLFQAGGNVSFFGANSGAYSALPTDGAMSRLWAGGNLAMNTPTNFAGQVGFVNGVPEPTTMILAPMGAGLFALNRWIRRRRGEEATA